MLTWRTLVILTRRFSGTHALRRDGASAVTHSMSGRRSLQHLQSMASLAAYQGAGGKAIIPASAVAKLNYRTGSPCLASPPLLPLMTRHSYSSLCRSFWSHGNQNRPRRGSSHCNIVVGMVERGGRRFLQAIGGNEGGSVRLRRIPIDRFGGIHNPQANNIFGIIKLLRC